MYSAATTHTYTMTKHRIAQLTMWNLQFLKLERGELQLTCHPLNYKLCRYRMVEWSKMQHKLWAHQHHSLSLPCWMIEAHFLGSYIRVKTLIKLKKPFLLSFELDVEMPMFLDAEMRTWRSIEKVSPFASSSSIHVVGAPCQSVKFNSTAKQINPKSQDHVLLPRRVWKVIYHCPSDEADSIAPPCGSTKRVKGEAILQKHFSWAPRGADATLNECAKSDWIWS